MRIDDGFEEGMQIPIYYDPMISKLIVHAENREAAIGRMKRAIKEYHIKGVKNTLAFGSYVMNHEAFVSGNFDTGFVKDHFKPEDLNKECEKEIEVAALLAGHIFHSSSDKAEESNTPTKENNWKKNRRIV